MYQFLIGKVNTTTLCWCLYYIIQDIVCQGIMRFNHTANTYLIINYKYRYYAGFIKMLKI